jgi:hypothetical protein
MNETPYPRHTGRSIGAVVAGTFVGILLSLGTDALLHVVGIFPQLGQTMSDRMFILATAYRTVYSVIGSYLIARLPPDRPMRHALMGGIVGIVLCLVGAIATWNREPSLGPHWYPLALIATALPCAWLDGKLRERQLREGQAL